MSMFTELRDEYIKPILKSGLPGILDQPSESGKLPPGWVYNATPGFYTEQTPPINAVPMQVPESGDSFTWGNAMMLLALGVGAIFLIKAAK